MGMTEFLLVVAVGGGILAVLFSTLKGAAGDSEADSASREAVQATVASAERSEIEDRMQAALRSLEEIEADFESGNLSESDYAGLRARYQAEVADLEQQLGEIATPSIAAERSERAVAGGKSGKSSALGWAAGVVAFVALAWLVMSQALSPRTEDGSITGSIPGQSMGASGAAAGVPVAEVDPQELAALEAVIAENPTDVEALVGLGHLYLRMGRNDELADVTQRALALEPENPEALTHMGMLLFSMQHPEGVMPSFDRALAADPDFPEALQFKGMVAFMRQDFPTAVEAWDRYVAVVPPEEVSPRIKAMLESARASAGAAESQ
jgi:cytochrome c-type biogenesis protein CcmH/NrfG